MTNEQRILENIDNKQRLTLLFAFFFMGASLAHAGEEHANISPIDCNEDVPIGDNDIDIFSAANNRLISWSHIVDNPQNFPGLHFTDDDNVDSYQVGNAALTTDEACTGSVFKTILVKKYANWDQQHANGLGHDFSTTQTYGEFQDIVIDIKLNSDETYINHDEYLNTYSAFLNEEVLNSIDTGMVNIGIGLTGGTLPDDPTRQVNASAIIELDQNLLSDQWFRLTVPVDAFEFYTQEAGGYTIYDTNLAKSIYQDIAVTTIRINPETHNGKVLRNELPNYEELDITESYKEMGVSIRNIAFRFTDDEDGSIEEDQQEPEFPTTPIMISALDSCEDTSDFNSLIVFDQETDHLSNDDSHFAEGEYETRSWSKVYDNWDATSASIYHATKDDYSVLLSSVQPDDTCFNLNVMKTILVKKYANWDSQHMSGLDYRFPAEELTFNDLQGVLLELKINSETTHIPSQEELVNTYQAFVDEADLEALDQSKVNLAILVFGEAFDDQSEETLVGMFTLNLDQEKDYIKDQWLRITIPVNAMTFVTQKDWTNTDRSLEDYLSTSLVGFKVHPETLNNKVIRNYNNLDDFENTVPELYKEMGVSVRKVALMLNSDFEDVTEDTEHSNQTDSEKDGQSDSSADAGSLGFVLLMIVTSLLGRRRNSTL